MLAILLKSCFTLACFTLGFYFFFNLFIQLLKLLLVAELGLLADFIQAFLDSYIFFFQLRLNLLLIIPKRLS